MDVMSFKYHCTKNTKYIIDNIFDTQLNCQTQNPFAIEKLFESHRHPTYSIQLKIQCSCISFKIKQFVMKSH